MRPVIFTVVGCLAAGCSASPRTEASAPAAAPVASTVQREPSEAERRADALIADMQRRSQDYAKLERDNPYKEPSPAELLAQMRAPLPTATTAPPEAAQSAGIQASVNARAAIPEVQTPQRPSFDILSADYAITEKNTTWWRFSWKMTIRNQTREPIRVSPGMAFKDSRGFILDTGITGQRVIQGSGIEDISDTSLINAAIAPNVAQASATIRILQ